MLSKEQHSPPLIKLELLGIGSMRDLALQKNLNQALRDLGLHTSIDHIRDINKLLDYGISGIPALRINDRTVFQNIVPETEDIKMTLQLIEASQQLQQQKIRKILVPTDFSPAASNAFHYALELGQSLNASLQLVHIHQPQIDLSGNLIVRDSQANLQQKKKMLNNFVEEGSGGVATLEKTAIESTIIEGYTAEELIRLSKESDNSLIVMATKGNSSLVEKIIGSIASEVGRRAHCPVLLIPEKAQYQTYRDIVYANDYQHNQVQTIAPLLGLARHFGAKLHFTHISPDLPGDAESIQVPVGNAHNFFGFDLSINRIKGTDILEKLKEYSTLVNADLLVMTVVRRNFLDSIFHKSQTRKMIYHADTPLLLLHQ